MGVLLPFVTVPPLSSPCFVVAGTVLQPRKDPDLSVLLLLFRYDFDLVTGMQV